MVPCRCRDPGERESVTDANDANANGTMPMLMPTAMRSRTTKNDQNPIYGCRTYLRGSDRHRVLCSAKSEVVKQDLRECVEALVDSVRPPDFRNRRSFTQSINQSSKQAKGGQRHSGSVSVKLHTNAHPSKGTGNDTRMSGPTLKKVNQSQYQHCCCCRC